MRGFDLVAGRILRLESERAVQIAFIREASGLLVIGRLAQQSRQSDRARPVTALLFWDKKYNNGAKSSYPGRRILVAFADDRGP